MSSVDQMRKKVSTTVYFEAQQHERLRVLSERTKVPQAEYVRMGLDLILSMHGADKEPTTTTTTHPTTHPREHDTMTDGMGKTVTIKGSGHG